MKKVLVSCVALLVVVLMGSFAHADTITFTLTTPNTPSLGAGPYATVEIDRLSTTTAEVTVHALSGYGLAGGTGTVGVNVNGTAFSSGFTPIGFVDDGAGNEDGFGNFSNRATFTSSSNNPDTASFLLTATGATTWASAGLVLLDNNQNEEVAVHVGLLNPDGSFSATGFAAGNELSINPTNGVPEPTSLAIFGIMGLCAGGARLLKRRKLAAA